MNPSPADNDPQTSNGSLLYNLVACLYLATFVIVTIFYGLPLQLLVPFIILAGLFILPQPLLGLGLTISLTMIFEHFFTLQSLTIDQNIYKLYPLDIVIGFSALGLILDYCRQNKRKKILFSLPEKLLLSFILLSLIYFVLSLFNLNSQVSVAFSTAKNYAFYPLLYFLILYGIDNEKKFKTIINTILLSGLALVVFIGVGLIRGQGLWTEITPLSTAGARFLAGTHAFYLTFSSLIVLSLISAKRFANPALVGLILWLWIIGILGSLMRHLWLALFFGGLILLFVLPSAHRRHLLQFLAKNFLVLISVILIIFLFLNLLNLIGQDNFINQTSVILQERVASLADNAGDTSISWRLSFWQSARDRWLENPVFGVGFGQKINLEVGTWRIFEEIRNIHNSPLAILVQMGILGVSTLFLFVFFVFKQSWQSFKNYQSLSPYYLGLVAALAAFIAASFFQPYLEANLTGIFFWIFFGLIRTSSVISKSTS